MSGFFVTGTDTGVGKTLVSCALLKNFASAGKRAVGMKPVAAGVDDNGENGDVVLLREAANVNAESALVNPYYFAQPIAPHLAAEQEGKAIRFAPILDAFATLRTKADVVVVEGVGGFRVPLGADGDSADLACALNLPVILVVGLRLGCINHALLTVEAIQARGLDLAGWVANCIDPDMLSVEQNVAALTRLLDAQLLGTLPYQKAADAGRLSALLRLPGQNPMETRQ